MRNGRPAAANGCHRRNGRNFNRRNLLASGRQPQRSATDEQMPVG